VHVPSTAESVYAYDELPAEKCRIICRRATNVAQTRPVCRLSFQVTRKTFSPTPLARAWCQALLDLCILTKLSGIG